MAIFHLKMQVLCRSHGRSLIASAAYRAGVRLHDEWQGLIFDYRRRKHVGFTKIYLPVDAPAFMSDREKLWNFAQAREKRKDSQLAREMHVALPLELTKDQRTQLIERYIRREFVSRGLVVDCCIHDNPSNPHAHLIVSMRRVTPDGFSDKCREMNGRDYLQNLRERWSRSVNAFLMARGHSSRIDHRSNADKDAAANTKPHNNKENHMATTKPKTAPAAFTFPHLQHRPAQYRANRKAPEENSILPIQGEVRPEIFGGLLRYLEELLRQHFQGEEFSVVYDTKTKTYLTSVDGAPRITVASDKITCMTGNDEEVRMCIQAGRDLGWTRIRLTGSEDFKRRAYDEALRCGYAPNEVSGYTPANQESRIVDDGDGAQAQAKPRPVNASPFKRLN